MDSATVVGGLNDDSVTGMAVTLFKFSLFSDLFLKILFVWSMLLADLLASRFVGTADDGCSTVWQSSSSSSVKYPLAMGSS